MIFLQLLRVKQYIKNLFVFAPFLFAGTFDQKGFLDLVVLFLFFSIAASSVYIFNDINDIEEDKKDNKKSKRPISSGKISIKNAYILSSLLFAISSIGIFLFFSNTVFYFLIFYVSMNILYSIKLKHLVIYDIIFISIGFILRILMGGEVSDTFVSPWLITIVFFATLFLAASKRKKDVFNFLNKGVKTRKVADQYSIELINIIMIISAISSIVSYAIFSIEKSAYFEYFYLSTFFVVIGFLKFIVLNLQNKIGDDPSSDFIKNKEIFSIFILWFIFVFCTLFLL